MRKKFSLIFLLYFGSFYSSADEIATTEQTFIVSFGVHNGPPFAIIDNNDLVGGIIKDVIDELANELNIIVSYVKVPRKRQAFYLNQGSVHAIVVSNPKWLANSEDIQWSEPLFTDQDILVFRRSPVGTQTALTSEELMSQGLKPNDIADVDDMSGMTVGTIRGYAYPKLDPLFATQELKRSDVGNIDLNFIRLEKGWIDTFVGSKVLIQHYLKLMAEPEHFQLSTFSVSEHNIQTALSANSPVSSASYNRVLQRLKDDGIIDAILKKYKINTQAEGNNKK